MDPILQAARHHSHRGRCHVFLGDPHAAACARTCVEPGNIFSPGIGSCGIGLWLAIDGALHAAHLLADEQVAWHFGNDRDGGLPPVLRSSWRAGPVMVALSLAHRGRAPAGGADAWTCRLATDRPVSLRAALVLTGPGPAGGRLRGVQWADGVLATANGLRLRPDGSATDCVIAGPVDDQTAMVLWELALRPGEPVELAAVVAHAAPGWLPAPPLTEDAATLIAVAEQRWRQDLPGRIHCADPRVAATWERCAWHLFAAADSGIGRIGAVNYPHLWLRDTVLVLRALDLLGAGELARSGCEHLAPLVFAGGFGAEADAPGQGLWLLVGHARLHGDDEVLRRWWPAIRERVGWLRRMRRTAEPLHAPSVGRAPRALARPDVDLVCLAARDGLVHGRMDWHFPDFYVNAWGVAGLRAAARAAALLGEADAGAWHAEACEWEAALQRHLLPDYGNDRDPAVTPHPSGVLAGDPELARRFGDWFRHHRLDADGRRRREGLWTYFEIAQCHNALLLGLQEEAWPVLDGLLEDACRPWGVAAYGEGPPGGAECLPFGSPPGLRGWLGDEALAGNMPHNWSTAEMICLLRDCFLRETDDGLLLGAGLPAAWRRPGTRFGVEALPTDAGPVSYEIAVEADGRFGLLTYQGPDGARCADGFRPASPP